MAAQVPQTGQDPQTGKGDVEITYREDGKIPIGIWIVWIAFFVFMIIYVSKWALPDFQQWWHEAKF
ncbi:MAG: hypothetical protein HY286_02145 [Planctomycetes bacterium]|nr:hypothetical protein [Planctomycetota bacterium]